MDQNIWYYVKSLKYIKVLICSKSLTQMSSILLVASSSTNPIAELYYIHYFCNWNLLNIYYVSGTILGAKITKEKSIWFPS